MGSGRADFYQLNGQVVVKVSLGEAERGTAEKEKG